MASLYTYRDDLCFGLGGGGDDHTLPVRIKYRVYPGCEATLEQPGEPATAELDAIEAMLEPGVWRAIPEWMFGHFFGDETLQAELLSSAADADEYARDQAAVARREEAMLELGR